MIHKWNSKSVTRMPKNLMTKTLEPKPCTLIATLNSCTQEELYPRENSDIKIPVARKTVSSGIRKAYLDVHSSSIGIIQSQCIFESKDRICFISFEILIARRQNLCHISG
jgi:hypothetical protein